MTINKNTVIGSSILKNVTYNQLVELASGNVLGSFLYTGEIINFKNLTSKTVSFGFVTTTVHHKLIVRARVFT